MADLRFTELAALSSGDLVAGDVLAIADISASETKKITVTDFTGKAVTLIADATIPGAKILFGAGDVPGSAIADGGIDTAQLADEAVTAAKLADESTVDLVTTLPGSGAFIGQIALDTDDSKIYCWNGTSWVSVKAAGSINSVVGSSAGVVNISVVTSGDEVTISTTLDNTSAAAQFLAGPTGAAGAVAYRAIAGGDLPVATTTTKGAVIVNGNGLTLSGDTIQIDNSITANTSTYQVVQYNANGLVTDGRDITSVDLPPASAGAIGGVSPGTGLSVDVAGILNHTNSVTPGTYPKVTVDAQGHVSNGTALSAADVPSLDANKITSGTFAAAYIGTNAITGPKIADYAVSLFGETQPTADHIGQFFFNPLTRDLFLWDGNVYQPVGISAGEIVFAGTYSAATNLVTSTTADGAAAGFATGAALPSPSQTNKNFYVVVDASGTGTAPAPTVALAPPDFLLSNGSTYTLIDVSETVTAQIASNIGFTPTGSIASTNVQSAIAEVDSEKLAKTGGTMTGDIALDNCNLVFEGATADDFETTLTVTDPTADRTVTFRDASGTVALTSDLDDGTY
jgi:hypothetical protein